MQKIFIVMLMYNIGNFFMTSGSSWKYYRDEMNDDANENIADGYNISNIKITKSIPFENKAKIIGNTPDTNFAIELDL